jgi:hypothetical protein
MLHKLNEQLHEAPVQDEIRKKAYEIFGICLECSTAMIYNRKLNKLVCTKCHPEITDREMTKEEKKAEQRWYDAEHDHLPA